MKFIIIAMLLIAAFFTTMTRAQEYYSTKLCQAGDFDCIQVNPGETWDSLFPDPNQRALLKRFNRLNTHLRVGMYVAIPEGIENADLMSLSPFPFTIASPGSKLIVVDLTQLAWGAYDAEGTLLKWGPASGGRNWCYDIKAPGKTVIGRFEVYDVRGENCVSTKFPIEDGGGAPMPYSLFFQGGYAIHGSDEVPGYNASHGCVRVFKEDAKWLNEQFVKSSGRTKVLILPYDE